MEQQEIKNIENTREAKKVSWLNILTLIAGIISLIAGFISAPAAILGVAYGVNKITFIFPLLLIIGSIGIFNRKKWSVYVLTLVSIFWYITTLSKGIQLKSGSFLLLQLIILGGPVGLLIYFWYKIKEFK